MKNHENAQLTEECKGPMTKFLVSKKAASLADGLRVSSLLEFACKGHFKDSTDILEMELLEDTKEGLAKAYEELFEYISELESLKAG